MSRVEFLPFLEHAVGIEIAGNDQGEAGRPVVVDEVALDLGQRHFLDAVRRVQITVRVGYVKQLLKFAAAQIERILRRGVFFHPDPLDDVVEPLLGEGGPGQQPGEDLDERVGLVAVDGRLDGHEVRATVDVQVAGVIVQQGVQLLHRHARAAAFAEHPGGHPGHLGRITRFIHRPCAHHAADAQQGNRAVAPAIERHARLGADHLKVFALHGQFPVQGDRGQAADGPTAAADGLVGRHRGRQGQAGRHSDEQTGDHFVLLSSADGTLQATVRLVGVNHSRAIRWMSPASMLCRRLRYRL